MNFDEITDHKDLVQFLEDWVAFDGDGYGYDVNGLFAILRACLRNLSRRTIEGDFEELQDTFDSEEIEMLKKLVDVVTSKT